MRQVSENNTALAECSRFTSLQATSPEKLANPRCVRHYALCIYATVSICALFVIGFIFLATDDTTARLVLIGLTLAATGFWLARGLRTTVSFHAVEPGRA